MEKDSYTIRTYFKTNKIFMFSAGLWPYQSKVSARIIQFFWSLQHLSIIVPEIIKLIESRHNADHIIESIPPIFYNIIIGILFGNTIIHRKKIQSLIEKIHTDWKSLSDKKEEEILTHYANVGKIMSLVYIVAVSFSVVGFSLLPLTPIIMDYINPLNVSRPKYPLYRVQLYIDDEKYFYTILMHAYTTTVLGVIPLLAVDILLANLIQHICGMFAILGYRLRSTMKNKNIDKQLDKKIYQEVVYCTKLHTRILEFIEDINNIFSISFGILLLVLVSLMSMTGLVVLIKWGYLNEMMRFGLFTVAELFHMFCYSYHSQDLINHNNELYIAICNSGWYGTSSRTQIIIKMMFLRCLKPCLIKCIIYPLSMENFTTVMKTTFSYFTVIKSCRY